MYNKDSLPSVSVYTTSYCGEMKTNPPGQLGTWTQSGDSCSPHCSPLYVNINASPVICAGDSTSLSAFISGGQAPYTYQWTATGFSSSLASPAIAPSVTTTYTLIVHDSSFPVSTGSAIITITCINSTADCCIPSTFKPGVDRDFSNTTASQVLSSLSTDTISTSDIILINGLFTVDTDITFISCNNMVMGPNARIEVLSGAYCSILSSTIQACSEMWQSIVAQPGSRLYIGDTHIDDGKEAVYAYGSPAEITIKGNYFNRNYIAIRLSQGNFATTSITGNHFSCTAMLKAPYSGKYTEAQIWLDEAKAVNICFADSLRNYIYDGRYGIHAFQSDFKVNNNYIGNIHHPSPAIAVYANGANSNTMGQLYETEIGFDQMNTIEDYNQGIFVTKSYNANIQNNELSRLNRGISVFNCRYAQVSIEKNKLNYFQNSGINLQDDFSSEVFVRDNELNMTLPFVLTEESRKGIYLHNSSHISSTLKITDNFIANCRTGIQVMNQVDGTIKGNSVISRVPDVELFGSGNIYRRGIWLQNSSTEIEENDVLRLCTGCTTDTAMNGYLSGINISDCESVVHDNHVQNVPTAFSVVNNCYISDLRCNVLDSCRQGFVMVNANLRAQGDSAHTTDNEWRDWLGPYKIEGYTYNNVVIPWYYSQALGPDFDPNPFDGTVIFPRNGLSDSSCTRIIPAKQMQEYLLALVNDSLYPDSVNEEHYQAILTAYEILKNNLQLLYAGTEYDASLQNFFTLTSLQNIGILSDIKEYLNSNDYANALLLNNELQPGLLMEANSQFLNEVVIKGAGDTITYDSLQKATMLSIAWQHPTAGGEAVYRARAILNLDLDDSYLPYRKAYTRPYQEQESITVFPNPGNGKVYISFSNEEIQVSDLWVFSTFGKQLGYVQSKVKNGNAYFDLSYLPSGIYLLKIKANETMKVTKLIVLK